MDDPQILAEARRLLADELEFHSGDPHSPARAIRVRKGLAVDIISGAALRVIARTLSPQPSSPDVTLMSKLTRTKLTASGHGDGKIIRAPVNPDGLEAAARITALSAQIVRAIEHFEARSELWGSDADCATGMANILRAALTGDGK